MLVGDVWMRVPCTWNAHLLPYQGLTFQWNPLHPRMSPSAQAIVFKEVQKKYVSQHLSSFKSKVNHTNKPSYLGPEYMELSTMMYQLHRRINIAMKQSQMKRRTSTQRSLVGITFRKQ